MNIKKNKSGFTLLEIIIVIIIIGVLASLALPRLFSTVEFSRSTEALAAIASVRSSMERCYLGDPDYRNCDTFTDIDIEDPGNSPGAHFTYSISAGAVDAYSIIATRTAVNGGNAGDVVFVEQAGTSVSRGGTGAFEAL